MDTKGNPLIPPGTLVLSVNYGDDSSGTNDNGTLHLKYARIASVTANQVTFFMGDNLTRNFDTFTFGASGSSLFLSNGAVIAEDHSYKEVEQSDYAWIKSLGYDPTSIKAIGYAQPIKSFTDAVESEIQKIPT